MNLNKIEAANARPPQVDAASQNDNSGTGMNLSRRKFLGAVPKVVTGAVLGAGVLGVGPVATNEAKAQSAPPFPWPYQALDPVRVAERAYAGFYAKGCMYGVFEGIIGELGEALGEPYASFPMAMMKYGAGGINGTWGTLCGCLNGAAAAISLVSGAPGPLIDEVYFWYSQELLPNYKPQTPRYDIVGSVSGSPICHGSVQNWCEASGLAATSPQRAERCGWLTASVAKYTAEQLNKQVTGSFSSAHQRPADSRYCAECHSILAPDAKKVDHGKRMDCGQCHSDIDDLHWYPSRHLQLRWKGGGVLEQANSPAGPWTVAPNQNNPQAVSFSEAMKIFRTKQ